MRDLERGILVVTYEILRNREIRMRAEHFASIDGNGTLADASTQLHDERYPVDDVLRQSRWALTSPLATYLHRERIWVDQPLPFPG